MNGWNNPILELTEEEKINEQIDALPPRDQALVMTGITLQALFCSEGNERPSVSHHKDIMFALLKLIKHSTSMDLGKLLNAQLDRVPEGAQSIPIGVLRKMFSLIIAGSGAEAEKAAGDAERLIALLPNAHEFGLGSK